MFKSSFLILLVFFWTCSNSQTKTSTGNGNWSNAATWSPNGVPTATNNVVISDGNTINLDISGVCNSLTIGSGTGAATVFRFSGNTTKSLTINADITVSSNGSFGIRNNVNTGQYLNLYGNIINNGTIDFSLTAARSCDINFLKNGNQTISGTGSLTDLNDLNLNMGSSSNNVLELSCSAFSVPDNFLHLTNGTFKLSTPNAVNAVPFTTLTTIPSSAGIWLNSSTAALSTSAGINNNGLIRISNGTLNIGNADAEDLSAGTGTLFISGGVLNIASKYNASSSASTFSMSGGLLTVPTVSSSNTSIAPFHISASGTSFNFSGGSIVIQSEGGTGAQNLGFVNTGSSSGTVNGGTLQIGNSSTPAAQIISINSNFPIPSLLVSSANATAQASTNSLSILGNAVINNGSIDDNGLNISVGGNWTNNGGSYVNNNGTLIFNSASGTQTIFKSGGESLNNLNFSGAGLKSLASPLTAKGFTIQNGSSVDVSSSNFQLNISGNFMNNGTFNSRSGLVQFNGSTAQSIGGSSITDFFDLTLSNPAGAGLTSAENLIGSLSLNSGTFSTNGQVFTLVSTATATARVAQITGGDISGNVTVQRFVPGGTTGWVFLGTPIASALTLQDWDDDIYISCSTCPDGSAGGFLSIYTYSEAASGTVDDPAGYIPLSGITDPIVFGKGYWVYFGNGQFTTSDITMDVTGSLRKQNQTIPLSYTNYGSSADDGWNLIHNPYPSAISWTALRGATANLDNAIYAYNADLNSGAGAYASFVNGVSSPAVGSGGIGDNIPMGQGFYVHSTGATAINATEAVKINANPVFLKTNSSLNNPPLLRLQIKDSVVRDESVLYVENNASLFFDTPYDAYKLPATDPLAPLIALQKDSTLFQINAVPGVNGTFTSQVLVTTGTSGTYTIGIADYDRFPLGTCIRIYDTYNNQSHDLKSGDYTTFLYDTTSISRFIISITLNPLSVNTSSMNPDCTEPNGGFIAVIGNSQGPWNYYWKDQNGIVLQNHSNLSSADTLKQLGGGIYFLEMFTSGLCDSYTGTYLLDSIVTATAQFQSPDSLNLDLNPVISFSNTSINSTLNVWDFGDGSPLSSQYHAQHSYTLPGDYSVKLLIESSSHCKDSISKLVHAYSAITGQTEILTSPGYSLLNLGENEYSLIYSGADKGELKAEVCDVFGNRLICYRNLQKEGLQLDISLRPYAKGLYFLRLNENSVQKVFRLLVQ